MVNITVKYKNDKNQSVVLCDQTAGPLTVETWHMWTGFQLI